jgi:uncharacterized protein (TIGR02300 family)
VAKPELGTKRLCAGCGAKFYDLNKDPIHCPKCGVVYEIAVAARPSRAEPVAPPVARPPVPEEVPVPEPQEVETVSLEEADAEAAGTAKKPASAEPGAEEEEVEIEETIDDAFIEEQEDEDADVTDIIGGDIEPEEEG